MNRNVSFVLDHNATETDLTQFDIIVAEESEKYNTYSKKLLVTERILACASSKNALTRRKISMSDLKSERFISMLSGSALENATISACKAAGFMPNISIHCDDPYYLREFIKMDFGIAFVPEFSWQGQFDNKIRFLEVSDLNIVRKTFVYYNRDKTMSKAARAFLALMCGESEA